MDILARLTSLSLGGAPDESLLRSNLRHQVVAVRSGETLGLCTYVPSAGRCATILRPRLVEWDEPLAARLIRAAAARAARKAGSRLIQALLGPEGQADAARAFQRAGFERLAILAYLRRPVRPEDSHLAMETGLEWAPYSCFRRREFARTIAASYQESLDCPGLAGLRTVDDAITTHKHTGIFCPKAWHVARRDGRAVGVELVNNLDGRGELVYLGVVAGARRRGLGRALLARAIRDSAAMGLPQMGLAVDVENTPALRLYEAAGFREIRRRLAYFVPKEALEGLDAGNV